QVLQLGELIVTAQNPVLFQGSQSLWMLPRLQHQGRGEIGQDLWPQEDRPAAARLSQEGHEPMILRMPYRCGQLFVFELPSWVAGLEQSPQIRQAEQDLPAALPATRSL